MAFKLLSITSPHLVYAILGGFTSLFMLCSSVIKERMYIGEATVATIVGLIFGPHCAKLIEPQAWGSVDTVTLEFSRIVLVVQCFAVGVELPKYYMEKHWRSVVMLLIPVMTVGWLATSLFVWWLVPPLSWLESLVVAACVTATDPVLASSVVGKGKFSKRVPKHLRDLLSAESGCNDGMAFPFIYLSLYLIQDKLRARDVTFHWIVYTILYQCIFGAVYGFVIGYIARHSLKYSARRDLIDRESFLVFYFVLALFCAGTASMIGVDDLLVGFSCGVGFSNDGWFTHETEESHVSNVIDLLLNLTYFVYLGTIIPWEEFNDHEIGLYAWKLSVLAIMVILFRRIPIMLALKPFIPDIKTWREALFAGHFGPIGVGAIFIAILARGELEVEDPVPLAELPPPTAEHYTLIVLVWPIVTFLVVASIVVHGSSVAVFTLGKHINTLSITMSYSQASDDGPSWMNRLPRISQSRSRGRTTSRDGVDELKLPADTLPPLGMRGQLLRRLHAEDNSGSGSSSPWWSRNASPSRTGRSRSRSARKRSSKTRDSGVGPGGPISQSAIYPVRNVSTVRPAGDPTAASLTDVGHAGSPGGEGAAEYDVPISRPGERVNIYQEAAHNIMENEEGDVLEVDPPINLPSPSAHAAESIKYGWGFAGMKQRFHDWKAKETQRFHEKHRASPESQAARVYQFGNTVIVENEEGEVIKKYDLPAASNDERVNQSLNYLGIGGRGRSPRGKSPRWLGDGVEEIGGPSNESGDDSAKVGRSVRALARSLTGEPSSGPGIWRRMTGGLGGTAVAEQEDTEDDRNVRFIIGGVGQRMTKEAFIREMQKLDQSTRGSKAGLRPADVKSRVEQERIAEQDEEDASATSLSNKQPQQQVAAAPPSAQRAQDQEELRIEPTDEQGKHVQPQSQQQQQSPQQSSNQMDLDVSPRSLVPRTGTGSSIPGLDSQTGELSETPAQRRRRELAVNLEGKTQAAVATSTPAATDVGDMGDVGDVGDVDDETPAERRRREAALRSIRNDGDEGGGNDDNSSSAAGRALPAERRIKFVHQVPKAGSS